MADYLAENQCPKCGKKLNTGFKCEVCDTMADKEERIFVARLTQDPYTCDIGGICKGEKCLSGQCQWGITRKQALDIIADALINFKYLNTASADDIEECEKEAEICLNALLRTDI